MHYWIVSLFKKLSTVVFFATVVPTSLAGFSWGHLFDYGLKVGISFQGTYVTFGIVGLVVGMFVGLVVATWTLGLVHVLIEISDNTRRLIELQERTNTLLAGGPDRLDTTTPRSAVPIEPTFRRST